MFKKESDCTYKIQEIAVSRGRMAKYLYEHLSDELQQCSGRPTSQNEFESAQYDEQETIFCFSPLSLRTTESVCPFLLGLWATPGVKITLACTAVSAAAFIRPSRHYLPSELN